MTAADPHAYYRIWCAAADAQALHEFRNMIDTKLAFAASIRLTRTTSNLRQMLAITNQEIARRTPQRKAEI